MADPLAAYRSKRDFTRTVEPSGAGPFAPGSRFVVQRHRATRLHYDLRLEIDGVLVSWAVPKGPTLDPAAKRLAVHVEDHPLDYLLFEGVIPAGEYGGGDAIVWDAGTWEPVKTGDPRAAVDAGAIHANLFGHKLRGRFALIRRNEPGGDDTWMLIHKRDEHAVEGWDAEDHPWSILSGRTNDQVAAAPARIHGASDAAPLLTPPPAPLPAEAVSGVDDLDTAGTWEVLGRQVAVTNLDKVLFPGTAQTPPVTKRELLTYAARIAPVAIGYLDDRPVNMRRFPQGIQEAGFWHKARPAHSPPWLGAWTEPGDPASEGTSTYIVPDEPAALVWLANYGAVEWHPWTSSARAPQCPSWALIDLDPGERTTWDDLLLLARLHRTALEHLGVTAAPKVSGARGIHIWIPVAEHYSFDQTRSWVERLSRTVGQVTPELLSWRWQVKRRDGLARLDYTQNAINKTLVAPYSPRARAAAPVSVPITWEELDDPGLRPDRWTIRTVMDRILERGDPFFALRGLQQELPDLE